MTPIRLLVVDDSRSMRMRIGATLAAHRDIIVVGEAGDPLEAREAIKTLQPDVVTLDVEMPKMSGLEFLEKLMRLRPMPVVMVSSLTGPGCDAAVKAMAIGAIDCVAKPEPSDPHPFADLAEKIRTAAAVRFTSRPAPPSAAPPSRGPGAFKCDGRIVAIGASTGGVEALSMVLAAFPAGCPPTVITQHMPPKFTTSFAQRLDRLCGSTVTEARDGDVLEPGRVYLAPGGDRHLTIVGSGRPTCRLLRADTVNGHRPSVDVLFASVAKVAGAAALGVVLTGMGRDGAQGLAAMRSAGASTIGQDEASSLIYGMPRAAFEAGAVERQLPLHAIGSAIIAKTASKQEIVKCP